MRVECWRDNNMDTVSLFFDGMLGLSAASANDLTTTQVCLRAVVIYVVC
jgi:hypothetical protein